MTADRLNELMREHYGYLSYDKSEAQNYLDNGGYTGTDDDMAAWLFADYLEAQDLCEVELKILTTTTMEKILTTTTMEKITTFQVTSLSYDDLVNLFSTAGYGNDAIGVEIPSPYRALAEGADCLEGRWAKVLLNGGQVDVYDLYDDSITEGESEKYRYGKQGTNWVSTSFRTFGNTDTYFTAYRISLETLLKGMSNDKALPYAEELFEKEEGDLYTAWNLMQITIFGEIIYG